MYMYTQCNSIPMYMYIIVLMYIVLMYIRWCMFTYKHVHTCIQCVEDESANMIYVRVEDL